MCYEIKKPITDEQRIDFIVQYNHGRGLRIEDTEMFLFALEPDEIMGEKEIEIEVVDPETGETHTETITIPYPVKDPDYEQKQAEKREEEFYSKFFEVQGFGCYRRVPKGYQSAVESMNVLFNIANLTQGVQAGLIIFYQKPDFTKPEECTEEWLVSHQIIMPAMNLQEFMQLYVAFMTAWNTHEHAKEMAEQNIDSTEPEE